MAQQFTTLYTFCSVGTCTDGAGPFGALVQGADGNFYGTTRYGGSGTGGAEYSGGTVFQMTPSGVLKTLYNFCSQPGCADGQYPYAPLVQGYGGYFYGTTTGGGAYSGSGVVFKIDPNGDYSVIYNFCSAPICADGVYPYAGLLPIGSPAIDQQMWGTASRGGMGNGAFDGTIFYLYPSGTMLSETYSFCSLASCADGELPLGALIQDSQNAMCPSCQPVFYGTTYATELAGNNDAGTLFKFDLASATLTTLYTFCSQGGTNCTDGLNPTANVVQGTDGNLYGTTFDGGPNYSGTIFKYDFASGTLTTLYTFCSQGGNCTDGAWPYAGLLQAANGNFYGTTVTGGAHAGGAVFEITPSGQFTSVYSFCSQAGCADGAEPYANLIQGTDGSLYGTTSRGPCPGGFPSCGTVFKLTLVPVAGVTPTYLTFPLQDVGTSSGTQFVTLTNTGRVPLAVASIAIVGNFGQTNNCGSSVPVGGSCTINVTFTPTAAGKRTGTLTITDNTGGVAGSQQAVSLAGTGTTSAATVSPGSLSFGNQLIGTTSAAQQVTLTSTGKSVLKFLGIALAGAHAHDFAATDNCPGTLNVGTSCTINVTFTPTIAGAEHASLYVKDNAQGSLQTVALSGAGVSGPATLSPASASFSNIAVGTTSPAESFTLKNNQSVALAISSIAISGSNAADFSKKTNCGSSLAANSYCRINVTFKPSVVGNESASLTVSENAPAPYNVLTSSLTGTGTGGGDDSPPR
jgi:uncharacterized repeat protein (TIGR03803 family)